MAEALCGSLDTVTTTARLLLGGVFCAAGWTKLASHQARQDLKEVGAAFRARVGERVIVSLAVVECELGVQMLCGYRVGVAATMAFLLLAGFTGVLIVLLHRGFTGRCGCFGGIGSSRPGVVPLGRNVILAGVAVVVAVRTMRADCVGKVWEEASPAVWMAALALFSVATILYQLAAEVEEFTSVAKL